MADFITVLIQSQMEFIIRLFTRKFPKVTQFTPKRMRMEMNVMIVGLLTTKELGLGKLTYINGFAVQLAVFQQ